MENIKKFENFSVNEEKKEKKSLRKSSLKKDIKNVDSELQALKSEDINIKKDKSKKPNLSRNFKSMREQQESQNYMFFGNLKTMKRLIDKMLKMDESKIDEMLKEHNWASDHIATSKDDVEEVFNFLAGSKDYGYSTHDGSFSGDDSEEEEEEAEEVDKKFPKWNGISTEQGEPPF